MTAQKPLIVGEVGSYAHGLNVATSDHDYHGIYADPPEALIGLKPLEGADRDRDQPEGVKSQPGDSETTFFGLREFIRQIVKGNPTYHTLLFTPSLTFPDMIGLQKFAPNLLSKRIAETHVGYATSMYRRLTGDLAPRTNRPDIIAAHGYDTKAAFHAIRLLIQGHEMLRHHTMTMPMHDLPREFLLDLRNGKYDHERAISEILFWRDAIEQAGAESTLPDEPDMDVVNAWLVETHASVWGAKVPACSVPS